MLTVFHTADWHLGQSFFGFDRDYEHACFLEWLLAELQSQRPDALIVAGDVFDSINPSAVSQKRYYNFLARAHAALPDLRAEDVPVLLHARGALTLQLFDPLRYRGSLSSLAADDLRAREQIDAILQRSVEAFPATTLGL